MANTSSNKLVNASLALDAVNIKTTSSLKTNTKEAEENAKAKEAQAKAIAKATKEQADLNKMVGASALSGLRIKSAESIAFLNGVCRHERKQTLISGAVYFLNGVCRHEPSSGGRSSSSGFLNGVCRHEQTNMAFVNQ